MQLDRSSWRVKLSESELKEAHKKGADATNNKKRQESQSKRDEAMRLRSEGMSLKDISNYLNVSQRTLNRWKLKKE